MPVSPTSHEVCWALSSTHLDLRCVCVCMSVWMCVCLWAGDSHRYLAAAGVGRLGIVDHDVVDVSNLHRQVAHCEARAGVSKSASAREAGM